MPAYDRRELAAVYAGGALGTAARVGLGRSPRSITDASVSTAVDSSTRQPCAAALDRYALNQVSAG